MKVAWQRSILLNLVRPTNVEKDELLSAVDQLLELIGIDGLDGRSDNRRDMF